jgi:hypothetical protein
VAQASGTNTATQSFNLGVDDIAAMATSGNPGALILTAPVTGGDDLPVATDSSTYLRYTSVVKSGKYRNMQAQITGGTVPAGTTLTLAVTVPTGPDLLGSPGLLYGSGTCPLSGTAQQFLQGVLTCVTGTGATDGANLSYTLATSDWRVLKTDASSDITVQFTFTDDH